MVNIYFKVYNSLLMCNIVQQLDSIFSYSSTYLGASVVYTCKTICKCHTYFLLFKHDSQKIPIFKTTQTQTTKTRRSKPVKYKLKQLITTIHHCKYVSYAFGRVFTSLFQRDNSTCNSSPRRSKISNSFLCATPDLAC